MQTTRQIKQVIGSNVQQLRREKGMSRRLFAEALGVDSMVVYKWERGLHRPNDLILALLAHFGDREPGWFYTDHEKKAA